jgi:hypothetical protein
VRQLRPKEDPQTVFVQGMRYHKLECVGRGGSSKVFKVRTLSRQTKQRRHTTCTAPASVSARMAEASKRTFCTYLCCSPLQPT